MRKISLIPEIIIPFWKSKVTAKRTFARQISAYHNSSVEAFENAIDKLYEVELVKAQYQMMLTLQMLAFEEVHNKLYLPAFLNNRSQKIEELKSKFQSYINGFYEREVITEITVNQPLTLKEIINNKSHLDGQFAAQALNKLVRMGKVTYTRKSREPPVYRLAELN